MPFDPRRLVPRRLSPSRWRDDPTRPPVVSIVTLSHNYARYLAATVRSVLGQSFTRWELVVVDDASDDDSLRVLRSFRDPRILVLPLSERLGAAAAYNLALSRCRGRYVASLDADDSFLPEKLEKQVRLLDERPEVDVVGTWIVQIDADDREVPDGVHAASVNRPRDFDRLESWVPSDYLTRSSTMIRRASHLRVGGMDPELSLAPDFDLWLRCLAAGLRFAVLPEPLTRYRTHAANVARTCDRFELWLELCFLFVARTAPLVLRSGRSDLLEPAMRSLASFVDDVRELELRSRVLRLLADFPLLPRTIGELRRAIPEVLGADTERLAAAIRGAAAEAHSAAVAAVAAPAVGTRRRRGLAVVDDYFPRLDTGFRVAEYNWYLEHADCTVYSTSHDFEDHRSRYAEVYPEHAERVRPFDASALAGHALLYTVFLTNAHTLLQLAEDLDLPLAFTLYPGGGFELYDAMSDLMLARLGRSERLVEAIVTQRATYDYVVGRGLLPAEKVTLLWGVAAPPAAVEPRPKRRWPDDKDTLDLCFVANKYMPRGMDKGYDVFVDVARRLAPVAPELRFHVVGGFGPEDVPLGEAAGRLIFHGRLPAHRLPAFFAGMDMILSPNRAFRLRPGATDGFPTASCTEAALAGVAVLCSDPLDENEGDPPRFAPGEEIVVVDHDAEAIAERMLDLRADPRRLHRLATRGRARSRELYGPAAQLETRLALLGRHLDGGRAR